MKFFECKDYATSLKFQLKQAFNNLEGIQPKLAIFRFDNGESQDTTIYIRQIQRLCNELGVALDLYAMTDAIETIKILSRLNNDRSVHGIMCMQPMDQYFSPDEVSAIKVMITPSKDIDCINDYNISKIAMGSSGYFYPATPLGIAFLLAQFGIEIAHFFRRYLQGIVATAATGNINSRQNQTLVHRQSGIAVANDSLFIPQTLSKCFS